MFSPYVPQNSADSEIEYAVSWICREVLQMFFNLSENCLYTTFCN